MVSTITYIQMETMSKPEGIYMVLVSLVSIILLIFFKDLILTKFLVGYALGTLLVAGITAIAFNKKDRL